MRNSTLWARVSPCVSKKNNPPSLGLHDLMEASYGIDLDNWYTVCKWRTSRPSMARTIKRPPWCRSQRKGHRTLQWEHRMSRKAIYQRRMLTLPQMLGQCDVDEFFLLPLSRFLTLDPRSSVPYSLRDAILSPPWLEVSSIRCYWGTTRKPTFRGAVWEWWRQLAGQL